MLAAHKIHYWGCKSKDDLRNGFNIAKPNLFIHTLDLIVAGNNCCFVCNNTIFGLHANHALDFTLSHGELK